MNVFRQNNLSLKHQRFTPSGCQDIGIQKFEFVAKTQLLWMKKGMFFYWTESKPISKFFPGVQMISLD